ncbi:hypothetical protein [Escherichia coli]|uniref:hypothetical protein n=1 Tax=Escherichia coli TaxID=562 RepID=UPI0032B608F8
MSVKITGLDKMQKQLKEVERATEALNGSYDVHFDANDPVSIAKWHLNRSQFGIRIDHDLASISDHSLASQSITIWHASDH